MSLRESRYIFIETGEIYDLPHLQVILPALEGPDRLLCRRLILIGLGTPDLNDPETCDLLTRRNSHILTSRYTDLTAH
jgi:hypothetical protein